MAANIVDLIVHFRGAASTGPLSENEVFPDAKLAAYKAKAAQANRQVARLGSTTNTIREASAGLLDRTMDAMREKLRDQIRGRIFIYGSSSGGRNALDLAARLSANNVLTTYLGMLDAAFFPNETSTPPGDALKDAPVFNAPFLLVFKKENYYQLAGNDSKMSFHGMIFTSEMEHNEIHGKVAGFDDRDLTDPTVKAAGYESFRALRPGKYHGTCIDLALPKAQDSIATLLADF
jgi:hypothetical protein